jgi:hypothetical protein
MTAVTVLADIPMKTGNTIVTTRKVERAVRRLLADI